MMLIDSEVSKVILIKNRLILNLHNNQFMSKGILLENSNIKIHMNMIKENNKLIIIIIAVNGHNLDLDINITFLQNINIIQT